MKLGILGGTFDPIHLGHLIIAEHVRMELGLEKVLLIPTGQPWMKENLKISEGSHRLAMVNLATASNPHFDVSSMEVDRLGATHTVDTLEIIHREATESLDLYFILGVDSLLNINRWHEAAKIFSLCTIAAVDRPGFAEPDLSLLDTISVGLSLQVRRVQGLLIEISGTELRRDVAREASIKYRVPLEVEEYIYANGLYKKERSHE